jgi:DNA-binding CsgD family transcriptional regulator/PAS domain-containing protein
MPKTPPLLALTEEIYDAAAGGTPWPVVEAGLKRLAGAHTAWLLVGDLASQAQGGTGQAEVLWREGFGDDAILAYRRHYQPLDPWTRSAATATARADAAGPPILTSGTLVPDREYLRSEFYNDFGRPLGLRWAAGAVVPLGEAGMMPIGLHRPDGAPPFGDRERRLLQHALPHLKRGMQLRHRLRAAEGAAGLAALDAMPLGVLVLEADLRVHLANRAAEALAAENDGPLRLTLARVPGGAFQGGRVFATARQAAETRALGALVQAVALSGGAGGAVRLSDALGAPRLAAMVSPLPARLSAAAGHGGGGRAAGKALLLLRPLDAGSAPRAALLRDLFGLTAAEAEVARGLAGGASKRATAAARGLSETTIRSQARALLEKTGAANLRDLERMLGGLQGL